MLLSRLLPRRSYRPLLSRGAFSTAKPVALHIQRSQRLFNQLDKALQPMRDCNEGMQIRRVKENEMCIELGGDNGCFSFQCNDGKVLMQSPVSGIHRYEYDQTQCWWKSDRDQHLLTELFSREIIQLCKGFPHL